MHVDRYFVRKKHVDRDLPDQIDQSRGSRRIRNQFWFLYKVRWPIILGVVVQFASLVSEIVV